MIEIERKSSKATRLTRKTFSFVGLACFVIASGQAQQLEVQTDESESLNDVRVEISIERLLSVYRVRFERLDIDRDGFVSKAEYLFLNQYPKSEQMNSGEDDLNTDLDSETDGLPSYIGMLLETAKLEFAILDQNKDDRISWTEMKAPVGTASAVDVNGDGKVDRSELASFLKLRTDQGKAPGSTK